MDGEDPGPVAVLPKSDPGEGPEGRMCGNQDGPPRVNGLVWGSRDDRPSSCWTKPSDTCTRDTGVSSSASFVIALPIARRRKSGDVQK